jgi:HSP20 family molecular chaperone IbpA
MSRKFFDLIACRPFELLKKRPFLLGREFENLFEIGAELMKPVYLKLYETEQALVARAEVSGFTEKDLNIVAEPCRLVIAENGNGRKKARSKRRKSFRPTRTGHLQDREVPGGNQARRPGCCFGG